MLELTVMVRLCRTCRVRQITMVTVYEAYHCGSVVFIISNFFLSPGEFVTGYFGKYTSPTMGGRQ